MNYLINGLQNINSIDFNLFVFSYIFISALGFSFGVVDISLVICSTACSLAGMDFLPIVLISVVSVFLGETIIFLTGYYLCSYPAKTIKIKKISQLKEDFVTGRKSPFKTLLLIRAMPTMKAATLLFFSSTVLDNKLYFKKYLIISVCYTIFLVIFTYFISIIFN